MTRREAVVEVVVHSNSVDQDRKFRHAPTEHQSSDWKFLLESSPESYESRNENRDCHVTRPQSVLSKKYAIIAFDQSIGNLLVVLLSSGNDKKDSPQTKTNQIIEVSSCKLSDDDGNDWCGITCKGTIFRKAVANRGWTTGKDGVCDVDTNAKAQGNANINKR